MTDHEHVWFVWFFGSRKCKVCRIIQKAGEFS